jgi:hypothetical protein
MSLDWFSLVWNLNNFFFALSFLFYCPPLHFLFFKGGLASSYRTRSQFNTRHWQKSPPTPNPRPFFFSFLLLDVALMARFPKYK